MSDRTPSQLPDAATLDGTEYFHVVQSGNSRRATLALTQQYVAAGEYVADRTALAAVSSTIFPVVYLREAGREGLFEWDGSNLSSEVTADPQQGVYVSPTGGDGSTGAWVRIIVGAFIEAEWFGAVADGATDDATAFAAAIDFSLANGYPLRLRGVRYALGAKISKTLPTNAVLVIEGQSSEKTELLWTVADGGLVVTFQDDGWWLRTVANPGNGLFVRKLSILTDQTVADGSGTALRINGATLQGRPMPPVKTDDICVRGASGSTLQQWQYGLYLSQVSDDEHTGYRWRGRNQSRDGIAVYITSSSDATADPISHKFDNFNVVFAQRAFEAGDDVEGIYLSNGDIVGAVEGVRWLCTGGESQISTIDVHMNVDEKAYNLEKVYHYSILGNNIFTAEDGIVAKDCGYGTIVGNVLDGASAALSSGVRLETAGSFNAGWKTVVAGNFIKDFVTGIEAQASVVGVMAFPNAFYNCTDDYGGAGTMETASYSAPNLPAQFTNRADAASNQALVLESDRATPANNDNVYATFRLSDSAGNQDEFGRISVFGTTVTSASEAAQIRLSMMSGGSLVSPWFFNPTSFGPLTDNVYSAGLSSLRFSNVFGTQFRPGAGAVIWTSGSGTPEGAETAPVGSLYTDTSGGANTTLYVKESGTGNTGWTAK